MAAQGVTALGSLIHLVVVTIARALKWVAGVFVVGIASLGMLFLTISLVVALVDARRAAAAPVCRGLLCRFRRMAACVQGVCVPGDGGCRSPWSLRPVSSCSGVANRLNTHGLTGLLAVWVVALLAATGIWSSRYPQLHQYWDEYPSMAEARNGLERFSAILGDRLHRSPMTSLTHCSQH